VLAVVLIVAQIAPVQPPQGSALRTPLPEPPVETAPEGPPLPLAAALRLARDESPDLAVVRERVTQAQNNVQRAWSALQPTLTANGSYTHSSTPNYAFRAGGGFQDIGHGSTAGSLAFAWNLFNYRAIPALQTALQQVDVSRLSETQQRRELLLTVAATYYSGLSLRALSRVSIRQARTTHDHAREADARYAAGLVQLSAALRARIDALNADQEARRAQFSYASAKSQLAAILDRRDTAFELEEPPQPPEEVRGAYRELLSRALRDRPELAAARANEEIAARLRTDAWAQFLPTLAVDASARYNDPAVNVDLSHTAWSVTLALTVPLYDGGFRYAALKDAASQIRQAQAQTRGQTARVEDEVRRAQLDLDSARALRDEAEQALSVARENERLVRAQFSAGTATQVEVSDAESALFQSESNALQQRLSVQLSALRLAQAVGAFDVKEDR
jgi:outer membrane protein TolC